MLWSSGNTGQVMRLCGPRQDTAVYVHTVMDVEQFCYKITPPFFTEAVNLWSRVPFLLTPWCAKGEVLTVVNLNRYAGKGSCIPWHCDNERLFGSPSAPKVTACTSLRHSVLYKLRRRALENSPSEVPLDHGDLLVMDGLTQSEYAHSTASELFGPRVNLAGLIGDALPSDAQDLAEPHSCGGEVEEMEMSMTCLMVLLVVLGTCFLRKYVFDTHEGVRCRDYHRGPVQDADPIHIGRARWIGHRRWRVPRRSHLMESWLFHFLACIKGGKKQDFLSSLCLFLK